MPTINLTDQGVKAMKVSVRTDFWDRRLPGFGVRISPNGRKVFMTMVRQEGRQRRLSLGTYPQISLADARDKAKICLGLVAGEEDPVAKGVANGGLTFEELAEEYIELYARQNKRSWQQDERVLRRDVLPTWGFRLVQGITRRDVVRVLDATVKRGAPVQANRTRALLSRVFSWAMKRDLVEHNPCVGVEKPTEEDPRQRNLSESEIRALWQEIRAEEPVIANALRLLLLTAQRSAEVKTMAWSQIKGNRWEIPGAITKNGKEHAVPLSRQALAVMNCCREEGSLLVLPSPRNGGEALSAGALSHAARRIVKRLGFQFTPHDLRRTAATLMGFLRVDDFIIGRVLNHTDRSVTGIYNLHSYWNEKLEALEKLGDHIESIVGPIDVASLAPIQRVH